MSDFLGIGAVARPAPVAEIDYAVVSSAGLLLALGLIMVYSSSIAIAAGVKAAVLHADAADESQVRAAVAEAEKSLGRLDILINMASLYVKTPNPTGSDWSAALDSNAKSAFLFSICSAPATSRHRRGAKQTRRSPPCEIRAARHATCWRPPRSPRSPWTR